MNHGDRVWLIIIQSLAVSAPIAVLWYGLVSRGPLSAEPILTAGTAVSSILAIFVTLSQLKQRKQIAGRRPTRRSPPLNAETILHLILPPEKCDDQVNTLDELYSKKRARLGAKRADIWYWKAVLGLAWCQLFRGRTRAAIVKLVCWFLRLFGLANVADLLAKAANQVTSEGSRPPRRRQP